MLQFDGRVALVTGAGGGLGRCYALLLASRGAAVVVNDLGVSRSGEGQSSRAADVVVKEITDKGGKAVANYDSVENGEALVKTAIDNFGRIDIIINNAGILRDRSIAKTSDGDWDLVHRVHLRGAFQVIRAAWPYMKKQNYGRIVNTSSVAGLYGNFGQANYSAAKLGLVGLTNTCAIEGEKSGIFCNVIVPMAASRLTEDIFPPELYEMLHPDLIAPVVAWMCHEECQDNGNVIEAAGGWAGKYRWQRTKGCVLTKSLTEGLSLEVVKANWSQVTDFDGGNFPPSNQEATMELVEKIKPQQTQERSDKPGIDPSVALGFTSDPFDYSFTSKDVILYSLSVGVSTEDEDGLQLLYEGHPEFGALSSFGTIPAFGGLTQIITGAVPGLNIDLSKVLHGEQYTEVINPIPTSGILSSTFKISAILDKGSGSVLVIDILSKDKATGQDILKNQMSVFVVGSGGFGGPRNSDICIPVADKMPTRNPDNSKEFKTSVDQPALYRLNGDVNPLHIDPGFAAIAGYDKPILHGLCSLGIAVRQIGQVYAAGNPNNIQAIKARFAKPVLPGQTIKIDMWKEGNTILFECKVKETGTICLNGGWIKLRSADTPSSSSPGLKKGPTLKSDLIFVELVNKLKSQPDLSKSVGAIFRWIITKEQKPVAHWILNLKTIPGEIFQEDVGGSNSLKADCTLTLSDDDMENLVLGKLKPQSAFMQGKLKIQGNMMLTQKLQKIIGNDAKL